MIESRLTTIDNIFDPFSQFEDWLAFDEQKGYFTLNYLARIANLSDDLTEAEEAQEIEHAIDEIIRLNVLGIYRKVYKDS